MIKFHKVSGKPQNVPAGEEHIWYSYPNGLYVADLQGNPRHIAPGKQIGSEVPVGVPDEPGLFYYNTKNKKNYISTAEKWVEVGTSGIPGSSSSGNLAGNVLVDDSANNYTSVDVEGVLAEIAEKFPWYFGKQQLKDFTGDVKTLVKSNEKYVATGSTNAPGSTTGWLSQRQASNGNTYGTFVDDNGNFYTRVNGKYTRMGSAADLDSLESVIYDSLGLKTGYGLETNGKTLVDGMEIGLSGEMVQRLEKIEAGANFVKKAGDTMTGKLLMSGAVGQSSQVQFSSQGSPTSVLIMDDPKGGSIGNSAYAGKIGGPRFRIYDSIRNLDLLSYYPEGSLDLNINAPRITVGNNNSSGKTVVYTNATNQSVEIKAMQSPYPLYIHGKNGRFRFWTNGGSGMNEFHSENGSGARRNLYIGSSGRRNVDQIQLGGAWVKTGGNLWTQGSVNIGFNMRDDAEMVGSGQDNCIRMFTNYYGLNGNADAKKVYAALYWDFKSRNFIFDAMRSVGNKPYGAGPIYINANGFITRSSREYKNIQGVFETPVLNKIKGVDPYIYTLKGDPEQDLKLGFILENGVPKEVINGKGIDTYSLVTYLWKGVQELAAEVDVLKAQLAE